ncbi:MAG: hypothetical protein ABGX23_04190 [Nautiliaceae bacterium]
MRFFMMFLGSVLFLFAYSAKVEPFDVYEVASPVAGQVIKVRKDKEAQVFKGELVKIDDAVDKIELRNINAQIDILKSEIQNQASIVRRKYETYLRYKALKTKSLEEKNLKYYDYMLAKNQLLSLKSQLSNLEADRAKILDTINKKSIKVNGYVNQIYVDKYNYVTPGAKIAEVDDISKEKLTIYIPIDKMKRFKEVYINGKKSNFKVYKTWIVPDKKYVTSYKVELVGSGLRIGEIVEVELK